MGERKVRRSNKLAYAMVVSLVTILVLSASNATNAFVKADQGCSGPCHQNGTSLVITTNATGVVETSIGTPFTLIINASGALGFNFYLSVEEGMMDNDMFLFTPINVPDNSINDLNPITNEISVIVTFTPLSYGLYTIRVHCATIHQGSQIHDVPVSVADPNPPTINNPSDIVMSEGDMTSVATWAISDDYPNRYEVLNDGELYYNDSWNGSIINVTLGLLPFGNHNLTMIVYDVSDNAASDQINVTVIDDTRPTILLIDDQEISEGSLAPLVWPTSDLHPSHYEVFVEETPYDNGAWGGADLSIELNALGLGTYNVSVTVNDTSGNSVSDSALITVVDGTAPYPGNPSDVYYPVGDTGHAITWFPVDLHPYSYQVLKNDSQLLQGMWNTTGEVVRVLVDGLPVGVHNFTLIVTDIAGTSVSNDALVTIFIPPEPVIDNPQDQSIAESITNGTITWDPQDLDPSSFEIYRNGILVKSGQWNSSSEMVTVSIGVLELGRFNFTIIVYDLELNSVSDLVWITIFDNTPPTIDHPDDLICDEGSMENILSWNSSDLHPSSYEIFRNENLVKSGLWNSSYEVVSISVDNLLCGTYTFTFIVKDVGNNIMVDEVIVNVIDGTSPLIDSPNDIQYDETSTGHEIKWNAVDAHPFSFEVQMNDTTVFSGSWNGSSVSINVDWLLSGSYKYTLIVTDIGGNSATDTVLVIVSSIETPTTTAPTTPTNSTTPQPLEPPSEVSKVAANTVTLIIGIIVIGVIIEIFLRRKR